ncbi:hypothetical protein PoB_004408600 [Plakobranchus ocellatus]|uniref:Uncharacterized protein n=1 Tax=Plakobranchus ocellatus TaxID=259542 RepID=A0AAV4BFJ5_9GAST|nr:hypothetical protein PoB_004408600 [Plakobranchus ocellatus]
MRHEIQYFLGAKQRAVETTKKKPLAETAQAEADAERHAYLGRPDLMRKAELFFESARKLKKRYDSTWRSGSSGWSSRLSGDDSGYVGGSDDGIGDDAGDSGGDVGSNDDGIGDGNSDVEGSGDGSSDGSGDGSSNGSGDGSSDVGSSGNDICDGAGNVGGSGDNSGLWKW